MSVDGAFERESITQRLKLLVGGRVYPGVPDDLQLERNDAGTIRPFISISFDTPYATGVDRSLDGEEDQPHFLPLTVECWAPADPVAHAVADEARRLLVGWNPSPGASELRATPGGGRFSNRSAGAAPTRFVEVQAFETTINLGDIPDGTVVDPGSPDGGSSIVTVQELIDRALQQHIDDPTPHPAYDNMPSLVLLFENKLI